VLAPLALNLHQRPLPPLKTHRIVFIQQTLALTARRSYRCAVGQLHCLKLFPHFPQALHSLCTVLVFFLVKTQLILQLRYVFPRPEGNLLSEVAQSTKKGRLCQSRISRLQVKLSLIGLQTDHIFRCCQKEVLLAGLPRHHQVLLRENRVAPPVQSRQVQQNIQILLRRPSEVPQAQLLGLLQQSPRSDAQGLLPLLLPRCKFRVVVRCEGAQRDQARVLHAVIELYQLCRLPESKRKVAFRKLGVRLHHQQIDCEQSRVSLRGRLLVLSALFDAADEVRLAEKETGLVVKQLQCLCERQGIVGNVEYLLFSGKRRLSQVVPALEIERQLAERFNYLQLVEGVLSEERDRAAGEEKVLLFPSPRRRVYLSQCALVHLQIGSKIVLNKRKKLPLDAGRQRRTRGLLQKRSYRRISLKDQIEEMRLVYLSLRRTIHPPKVLTKKTILQGSDNFLFGTCPLKALSSSEPLYVPFHRFCTSRGVLFIGALQEGPVDGRVKHYVVIFLLRTHPHHSLQVFLQSLLVPFYALPPQLQLHRQVAVQL